MGDLDFNTFDRLGGLVVVLDAHAGVLCWNRTACELSGVSSQAARGHTLDELAVATGSDALPASPDALPSRYMNRWKTRSGEDVWIAWSHAAIEDPGDAPARFVETGVVLAADALRLAQADLREEVICALAHDVRNPLHAIKLTASLLRRKLNLQDALIRDSVEAILSSTDRAKGLVEDLSDVTRLESGRFELELQRASPSEVFLRATDAKRAAFDTAGVELSVEVPEGLPALSIDPARIAQGVDRLLEHALRLTPRGGEVRCAAQSGGGEVVFSIQDGGPGIPADRLPQLLARVWEPSPARGKLHLGLPIARGLIEAHGGRIWATSPPGGGSVITFALPVDAGAQPAVSGESAAKS